HRDPIDENSRTTGSLAGARPRETVNRESSLQFGTSRQDDVQMHVSLDCLSFVPMPHSAMLRATGGAVSYFRMKEENRAVSQYSKPCNPTAVVACLFSSEYFMGKRFTLTMVRCNEQLGSCRYSTLA